MFVCLFVFSVCFEANLSIFPHQFKIWFRFHLFLCFTVMCRGVNFFAFYLRYTGLLRVVGFPLVLENAINFSSNCVSSPFSLFLEFWSNILIPLILCFFSFLTFFIFVSLHVSFCETSDSSIHFFLLCWIRIWLKLRLLYFSFQSILIGCFTKLWCYFL